MTSPGSIWSSAAGAPCSVNGAPGGVSDWIVSGWPPALANVTVAARCSPTTAPPNDMVGGEAVSSAAAVCPVPLRPKVNGPLLVVTVSVPPAIPGEAGVKSTGTVRVPPAANVLGSPRPPDWTAKVDGEAATAVIVTPGPTVSLTSACAVSPTVVTGKVVAGACTSAWTGAP